MFTRCRSVSHMVPEFPSEFLSEDSVLKNKFYQKLYDSFQGAGPTLCIEIQFSNFP